MTAPLIDREFLERLERLTLHWQKSFPGLVGGHNTSRFAGAGQEFLDHRNFHYGDDLRAVNWRAYMRLEKLFLKMFQVEPRVPVRLLLDVSGSMHAGAAKGEPSKFEFSRRLAAALAYVGLVRLDAMTLQPFAERLHDPYLCSGGRHRFQPAEVFLRGLEAKGRTDFHEVARQFISSYSQRGLLVVISDFLGDADCLKPLQYLADFGQELFLVQVWGGEDREPTGQGELELIDAESGATAKIALDDEARERYTTAFEDYCTDLRKVAYRNAGRYVGLPASANVEDAVFGPLVGSQVVW